MSVTHPRARARMHAEMRACKSADLGASCLVSRLCARLQVRCKLRRRFLEAEHRPCLDGLAGLAGLIVLLWTRSGPQCPVVGTSTHIRARVHTHTHTQIHPRTHVDLKRPHLFLGGEQVYQRLDIRLGNVDKAGGVVLYT